MINVHAWVFADAKRVATRVAPSETTKLSSDSSVTPAAACSCVMLAIVACEQVTIRLLVSYLGDWAV